MADNYLTDLIGDLSPKDWRRVLLAAADTRCIACGEWDACACRDDVDVAKDLVCARAADVTRIAETGKPNE